MKPKASILVGARVAHKLLNPPGAPTATFALSDLSALETRRAGGPGPPGVAHACGFLALVADLSPASTRQPLAPLVVGSPGRDQLDGRRDERADRRGEQPHDHCR